MTLHNKFEAVNDDYLKFERVENKRSNRPDLHAFLLLEELFPGECDMICHAARDEIWLDVEESQVASLSDEQILELTRCGVRLDSDDDSLCMFV